MTEQPQKYSSVFWIEVDKIVPNPMQPRREFHMEHLESLSESIRQYGVLQPLVVTRKELETPNGIIVEYELIAGERRLRASKLAGLHHVPVIIREQTDDKIKLELAIIENLQREDLNPIERALAFKKLIESFSLKHHEVGKRVGKSRVFVTNTLRLLNLPEEMQEALRQALISEGHARPILMLSSNREEQANLFNRIMDRRLTVREAERISRQIAHESSKKIDELIDQETRIIEESLSNTLGTKVQIEKMGERGRIHIDFFSEEELRSFLDKMTFLRDGQIKKIELEKTTAENPENIVESIINDYVSEDTGFESVDKPIYGDEVIVEMIEELPTTEIEQPDENDFLKSFTI